MMLALVLALALDLSLVPDLALVLLALVCGTPVAAPGPLAHTTTVGGCSTHFAETSVECRDVAMVRICR